MPPPTHTVPFDSLTPLPCYVHFLDIYADTWCFDSCTHNDTFPCLADATRYLKEISTCIPTYRWIFWGKYLDLLGKTCIVWKKLINISFWSQCLVFVKFICCVPSIGTKRNKIDLFGKSIWQSKLIDWKENICWFYLLK